MASTNPIFSVNFSNEILKNFGFSKEIMSLKVPIISIVNLAGNVTALQGNRYSSAKSSFRGSVNRTTAFKTSIGPCNPLVYVDITEIDDGRSYVDGGDGDNGDEGFYIDPDDDSDDCSSTGRTGSPAPPIYYDHNPWEGGGCDPRICGGN